MKFLKGRVMKRGRFSKKFGGSWKGAKIMFPQNKSSQSGTFKLCTGKPSPCPPTILTM